MSRESHNFFGEFANNSIGTNFFMLNFKCYLCKRELNEPGALLFSPPEKFEYHAGMVNKYHICADCFLDIMAFIHLRKPIVRKVK